MKALNNLCQLINSKRFVEVVHHAS